MHFSLNLSNIITITRIIFALLVGLIWYQNWEHAALIASFLYLLAALSDSLDGIVARARNEVTHVGALLDLLADKILVTVGLICLISHYDEAWVALVALVMFLREFIVTSAREWVAQHIGKPIMQASKWGKIKTVVQLFGITMMMGGTYPYLPLKELCGGIGEVLFCISAVMAVMTAFQYLQGLVPYLTDSDSDEINL